MQIAILVLAAGAGRRMRGVDKVLEPVGGQPLLLQVVRMACDTGLPVTVALPPDRPDRAQALAGLDVQTLTVADAHTGMAASLRAGVAALPKGAAVLLLLADMPEVDGSDLDAMIAAYRSAPDLIHRAVTPDGVPGHPVIFPPSARAALLALQGDTGARAVLAQHGRVVAVPLPHAHATTDLDTPEEWALWRAAQPKC
jgi:molybdenum cofactor cytidylyltransferase